MAKKILVIDDDHLVVKSLERLLKETGYVVAIAESGQEAVKLIEQANFDLIISDVRMPVMDGVDTVRLIMECFNRNGTKPPPVIFITGYISGESHEKAKKLDTAALIYKPFDKNEFLKSIATAIGVNNAVL